MNTLVTSPASTTKTRQNRIIRLPRSLALSVPIACAALFVAIIPFAALYLAFHSGNTVFVTISSIVSGTPVHYMFFIGIAAVTGYRCTDAINALMHGYLAVVFFDVTYGLFCWLITHLPFTALAEEDTHSFAHYVLRWHIMDVYLELALASLIGYGGYRLCKLRTQGRLRDFLAGPLLIATVTIVILIFISGLVEWFGHVALTTSSIRSSVSMLFVIVTLIWLINEYPNKVSVCLKTRNNK